MFAWFKWILFYMVIAVIDIAVFNQRGMVIIMIAGFLTIFILYPGYMIVKAVIQGVKDFKTSKNSK